MRTYRAEKQFPWPWLFVVEVEGDAKRAGCFAEQQLRLGLVVDGARIDLCLCEGYKRVVESELDRGVVLRWVYYMRRLGSSRTRDIYQQS